MPRDDAQHRQNAGLAFEDEFELAKVLEDVRSRSEIPAALRSLPAARARTAAVQGLGRMNSEAIRPDSPVAHPPAGRYPIGPFLPLVFRAQFGYCYSFCPQKMDARDARAPEEMRAQHRKRRRSVGRREAVASASSGWSTHENPALEVLRNWCVSEIHTLVKRLVPPLPDHYVYYLPINNT